MNVDQPDIELRARMAEYDLYPPEDVIWDGRIHRFPGANKQKGKSGWYRAFVDRRGAVFGDYSSMGEGRIAWQSSHQGEIDREVRQQWKERRAGQAAREAEERKAAILSLRQLWGEAKPATEHPYFTERDIEKVRDVRVSGERLLIPMRNAQGHIVDLQRIWKDSKGKWKKRYYPKADPKGCRTTIGGKRFKEPGDTIYICEGWATGWTIRLATKCAVIVAFSADGLKPVSLSIRKKYPEARIIIAADNDRWTSLFIGMTDRVPNPGLIRATEAAKECKGEIAVPDFRDLAQQPTDFDDLRQLEGLGAVKHWLDPRVAGMATTLKPEDEEPKEPEEEHWTKTATFRPLGHDHNVYYIASELTGQVLGLSTVDLGRSKSYYSLAPRQWWKEQFPQDPKPHFNVEEAANAIIESCIEKGVFRAERYRGRGAWRDEDQKVLLHLGDRLLAPGDDRYQKPERFIDGDRIYPRLGRLDGPAMKKALALDKARSLLGLLEDLSWENEVSGTLLAGFIVLSPFSGALRYRPHVWLTGPTDCGKSTIINKIIAPLLQCAGRIHREAHLTSEAAIRQKLNGDALPVILDEADMTRPRAKSNIQGLFDLSRSASTGGIVSKGSVGGTAVDYQVRSMFLFTSVVVGLSLEQDKNRMAVLALQDPKIVDPAKRLEHWNQLQGQIFELVSPDNGRRLMARTTEWFRSGRFDELHKVTTRAAFNAMQTSRAGELYGTLVAGAWTLKTDEIPDIEEVTAWMKDADLGLDQVAEKAVNNSYHCLSILLQEQVPIQIGHVRDAAPIGQLVDVVAGQTEDIGIEKKNAEQVLRRCGLLILDGCLYVANTGEWLKKLYKDTPFEAGWVAVLRGLPDTAVLDRHVGAMRFYPGLRSRVTKIPLRSLQISGF